jgi:hypothetical protein
VKHFTIVKRLFPSQNFQYTHPLPMYSQKQSFSFSLSLYIHSIFLFSRSSLLKSEGKVIKETLVGEQDYMCLVHRYKSLVRRYKRGNRKIRKWVFPNLCRRKTPPSKTPPRVHLKKKAQGDNLNRRHPDPHNLNQNITNRTNTPNNNQPPPNKPIHLPPSQRHNNQQAH